MLISGDAVDGLAISDAPPPGVPATVLVTPAWPIVKRPRFAGRVQQAISGREQRLLDQTLPIWEWVLTYPALLDDNDARASSGLVNSSAWYQVAGLATAAYGGAVAQGSALRALVGFFETAQGADGTFFFRDPSDSFVTGQVVGTGDGVTRTFQLVRTLGGFVEPITAPDGVAVVYLNGAPQPATSYSVDRATGLLTFVTAPASGAAIGADFPYYFRVRFSDDTQDFDNFMLDLWELKQVKLQSVLQ